MRLIQRTSTDSELRGMKKSRVTLRALRSHTWPWATACVVAGAFLLTGIDRGQQAPAGNPEKPITQPGANGTQPDAAHPTEAAQQMQPQGSQEKKLSPEAASADRKKQFSDDSAHLLKLANELKAEVDKTDKDTLSISVIRKADEIERLAHMVKEKMRLTVLSN
jgi:hypothetical protein